MWKSSEIWLISVTRERVVTNCVTYAWTLQASRTPFPRVPAHLGNFLSWTIRNIVTLCFPQGLNTDGIWGPLRKVHHYAIQVWLSFSDLYLTFTSWNTFISLSCATRSTTIFWFKQNLFIQRPLTVMDKNMENACGKLAAQLLTHFLPIKTTLNLTHWRVFLLPVVCIYVASGFRNKPRTVNTGPEKSPEKFQLRSKIGVTFYYFVSFQCPCIRPHCSFCKIFENYQ